MPPKKLKRIKSDSAVQRGIEKSVREQLVEILKWHGTIEPRRISYGAAVMEFDCYGESDGTVLLAEINAHHGSLKAAQRNKVLRDIFKMYAQSAEEYEKAGVTSVRMVIVFTNADASKFLDGRSWAAEAARKFAVESVVVPLKAAEIKALQKTQKDQDLRN